MVGKGVAVGAEVYGVGEAEGFGEGADAGEPSVRHKGEDRGVMLFVAVH